MYETIKRHGETYVYQGTTCIAIATAEGEKAVEELVQKSNQGEVNQGITDVLRALMDSGFDSNEKFYIPSMSIEKMEAIRALLAAAGSAS